MAVLAPQKSSAFFDADDRRAPRTEAPAAEPGALPFDVGGAAVAEFDRDRGELDILEMPGPSRVHLGAGDDAAVGNFRGAAAFGRARRGDLRFARQRHAERLARHSKRHHCAR